MWDWIDAVARLNHAQHAFALVTVIEVVGSTPRNAGAKMVVHANGSIEGTIGGGQLENLVIAAAVEAIELDETATRDYPLGAKAGQCCGGKVQVFIEPMNCGPSLYVYGAGHVGQAVTRTMEGTPFVVHLIDPRHEWIHHRDLPKSVSTHHCDWDDFNQQAMFRSTQSYAVVMTHGHDIDQAIIEDLLRRNFVYLGLIGSQAKWQRFKKRMAQRGFSQHDFDRVQCPLGISLGGGKAPQEVAISLAAELLRVYYAQKMTNDRT